VPIGQQHKTADISDIAALRIVAVTVGFKPDVEISWVAAEQEFVDRANAERARDPKPRKVKLHDGIGDPAGEEHRRLVSRPEGKIVCPEQSRGAHRRSLEAGYRPEVEWRPRGAT
jgi:hypothetical protein